MPLRRKNDEITPKITAVQPGGHAPGHDRMEALPVAERKPQNAAREQAQQRLHLPPINQRLSAVEPSQQPAPTEQHVHDAARLELVAMAEALRLELASTEIHMDVLRKRQISLAQRLAQLEGAY